MSLQRHITRLPTSYFDSTQTGVLISRVMNDAEGIRNLVGTGLVQMVGGLVTAVIALGVLFYLNWRLTLISIVVLALFAAGMIVAFGKLRPLFRERGKITAEVSGRLAESFGGIRIVKAYIAEKREDRVFATGAMKLFATSPTLTGISAVTSFGGHRHRRDRGRDDHRRRPRDPGRHDDARRFHHVHLLRRACWRRRSSRCRPSARSSPRRSPASIASVRSRRWRPRTMRTRRASRWACCEGEVAFDERVVRVRARRSRVEAACRFTAPAGTTTALVGSSGSGKSTLISLIMAFNRPRSGRVLVDGRDLARVRLRDYRAQLGVVLQDNFMFDGTVAENIGFSRPTRRWTTCEAVSRIAHCDEFVEKFPNKYDTIVGERGVKLSGGQRQRVAIARAILADPRILILDEATSSLDSESEALIQDGLHALRRGRTTFVIAHRLSTIRSADQILVLEAGEIVERGTHDELLAAERPV